MPGFVYVDYNDAKGNDCFRQIYSDMYACMCKSAQAASDARMSHHLQWIGSTGLERTVRRINALGRLRGLVPGKGRKGEYVG